jgi:hypothetical protein
MERIWVSGGWYISVFPIWGWKELYCNMFMDYFKGSSSKARGWKLSSNCARLWCSMSERMLSNMSKWFQTKWLWKEAHFSRKLYGGGVVVSYRKCLSQYIKFVTCCTDSMIWYKFDKSVMLNDEELYMCTSYLPPDRNVFYRKYNCDGFEILQEQIEYFWTLGTVSVTGDLNGRVVILQPFLLLKVLSKPSVTDS